MSTSSLLRLWLLLGLSFFHASDKICVFDIDGTTLNDVDTNLSRAAIQACKDAGFKLGVNTAETSQEVPHLKNYF